MQVEIIGKFYDNHSLSIINRNLASQLYNNNIKVSVLPTDTISDAILNIEDIKLIKQLTNTINEPDIQIRHSYPPIWRWPVSNKTKVVYIQPWEFSSMPSEWQYKFDTFADAVIVPSNWNKQVYMDAGINPNKLFVVENGYNDKVYYNKNIRNHKKIKFIYVGCNQYRKGLDILLNLWSNVTSEFDNLELIIKDNPRVYGDTDLLSEIVKLQYNKKCATIKYIDDDLTESQLSNLYNESHVIIHPYRGEGFGMHVQEAMACGCIPIVTSGGPTDEFVKEFKIPSSKKAVNMHTIFGMKPEDSLSNMGQHRFVLEPDVNQLFNIIKHVVNNIHKIEAVDVSKLNTWDAVGRKYITTLETINSISVVRRTQ